MLHHNLPHRERRGLLSHRGVALYHSYYYYTAMTLKIIYLSLTNLKFIGTDFMFIFTISDGFDLDAMHSIDAYALL